MNRQFGFVVFLILPVLFFASCSGDGSNSSKDVKQQSIYFDYQVWGEEGNDEVTILIQYRVGGKYGRTLLLEEPSRVELDGQPIKADSTKMTGAFYEVQKPVSDFGGTHSIVFTDINKKKYREEFVFQPVSLAGTLPDSLRRGDLRLELKGLDKEEDVIRVLLTDTSRYSEGIDRMDTVRNGRLIIKKEELTALVNGPVHLELFHEKERPVKNATAKGGRISFSYRLSREFTLKN